MDHLNNDAPSAAAAPRYLATFPGTGTPGEDYVLSEGDRAAMVEISRTVEFLMTALSAIALGYPRHHPEVTEYLTFARLKMPR